MNKDYNSDPVERNGMRLKWSSGGVTPYAGWYWVQWNFGESNQSEPVIRDFYAGYQFADTTKWAGPIEQPVA